jgi:hypothetical protein
MMWTKNSLDAVPPDLLLHAASSILAALAITAAFLPCRVSLRAFGVLTPSCWRRRIPAVSERALTVNFNGPTPRLGRLSVENPKIRDQALLSCRVLIWDFTNFFIPEVQFTWR